MAKHSIHFGMFRLGVNQAIESLQKAVEQADLQPGGSYTLTNLSEDETENDIIAIKENLPRSRLAKITESPQTYNGVSMGVWSDVMKLLIALDVLRGGALQISLVAISNILKKGSPWIVQVMSSFQTSLDAKASLLCDEQDEGEVSRRVIKGEELHDIVLNRVRGTDALPKPLLALVKAELCSADIHQIAKDHGIRTGLTSKMYVLFSTLDAS